MRKSLPFNITFQLEYNIYDPIVVFFNNISRVDSGHLNIITIYYGYQSKLI